MPLWAAAYLNMFSIRQRARSQHSRPAGGSRTCSSTPPPTTASTPSPTTSWTSCPASSRWQVFGLGEVGGLRVGVAEVDLDWAVPGQVLVGSDGVVLDAVVLDVGGQVDRVGDLFEEQPFVLQGAEAAFA